MGPDLAVISNARMQTKIEGAIALLQSLHKMAVDSGARKNLKRAIISTQNALRIYEHHNQRSTSPMTNLTPRGPQRRTGRERRVRNISWRAERRTGDRRRGNDRRATASWRWRP